MALTTKKDLRTQVMYSVFVRQYSKEGTFRKVREDVKRIRALGVDIIWLMPIHPIGVLHRKGTLGSPYAIQDYRAVNPEFGTLEDFRDLVDTIHENGMKCIIDVVYNHTSPDSVLSKEHPEWFYHKPDGSFGNKIGDWTDIIDLDYNQTGLWDYQIETLKQWAGIVDGFRCDVAPLVPLDFWLRARREVAQVRPDCIWLSETVEPSFVCENREHDITCLSDSEIYQAFDISYEYDVYSDFTGYLTGQETLQEYTAQINRQEAIYPDNYVKLRLLENHDRLRAACLIPDEKALRNWTAFLYFQKGMTLLYNGQETENTLQPGLFEKDDINWHTGHDLTTCMQKLAQIKKDPLFADSRYEVTDAGNQTILAVHHKNDKKLIGLFHTDGKSAPARVPLAEGTYHDLISDQDFRVKDGMLQSGGEPVIFKL